MKFRKNKRGFLLAEETLKIIIAVISIGFLVYFLVSLYNSNKSSKDLEEAEASLDFLIEQMNENIEDVEIYNPINTLDISDAWDIISWPNEYTTGALFWKQTREGIPNSCSNLNWESCLCFCPKVNPNKCDSKGVCKESEFIIPEGHIKIKNPPVSLKINYEEKTISEVGA